ncbi:MAG: V-type ATPase 116kDa subunit family protein, partial [bacterium]
MNPSIITIITFPFMFGLMFGDIGHGMIYLIYGLILTLFPDKYFFSSLKPFRYLILFLGLCSTFCGIIYNEFFSI